MKILVVHGNTHGHTARSAERIAARLREHAASVVVAAKPSAFRASDFDAVVVGGRVHGTRYPWRVTRFIRQNSHGLRSPPSALFSVSLLQLGTNAARRSEHLTLPARYGERFGWRPDCMEVFGGALKWKAQYGLLAPLFKRM